MAKRLENPNVDDLGFAGVELTPDEFNQFVGVLKGCGLPDDVAVTVSEDGYLTLLKRDSVTERIFGWLKIPADASAISVCRIGRLEAMKERIQRQFGELHGRRDSSD